jgi:hypothetical protein
MKMEGNELTVKSETALLIQQAIAKDLDVDKLEKLLALHERNEARLAEKEFEFHFAEMQKDYIPAFKTKAVKTKNGTLAYSYCPLPLILSVYAPILARHGFSYRWEESEAQGANEKTTTCFLSGWGFSRHASITLPFGEVNPLINATQARGATSEYGRRYTFMNVTGCIVADDTDTDGVIPGAEQPAERQEENSATPEYQIIGDEVPADYKEKKDEYRRQGFGCKKINGVWAWVKYGAYQGTPQPEKQAQPVQPSAPAAQPAPPTATAATKLTESGRSQIVDMTNEMIESHWNGWTPRRAELTIHKGQILGDDKTLPELVKEYQKFLESKKSGAPAPAEAETKF